MKKLNKNFVLSVLALSCISPVMAETVTGNLTVTAEVTASCVLSAGSFLFEAARVSDTKTDVTAMVGVLCSTGTSYEVKFNAGTGDSATTSNRSMKSNSGDFLKYSLSVPSQSITNLGDTPGSVITGVGYGVESVFQVVASIPGGQYLTPGNYNDTLTVTLEY